MASSQLKRTLIQQHFVLRMIAFLHQGVKQYVCRVVAFKAVLGVFQQLIQGRRLALQRQAKHRLVCKHIELVGCIAIHLPYPARSHRVFYPLLC